MDGDWFTMMGLPHDLCRFAISWRMLCHTKTQRKRRLTVAAVPQQSASIENLERRPWPIIRLIQLSSPAYHTANQLQEHATLVHSPRFCCCAVGPGDCIMMIPFLLNTQIPNWMLLQRVPPTVGIHSVLQ